MQYSLREYRVATQVFYLVHWEGYSHDDDTWEPPESFGDSEVRRSLRRHTHTHTRTHERARAHTPLAHTPARTHTHTRTHTGAPCIRRAMGERKPRALRVGAHADARRTREPRKRRSQRDVLQRTAMRTMHVACMRRGISPGWHCDRRWFRRAARARRRPRQTTRLMWSSLFMTLLPRSHSSRVGTPVRPGWKLPFIPSGNSRSSRVGTRVREHT